MIGKLLLAAVMIFIACPKGEAMDFYPAKKAEKEIRSALKEKEIRMAGEVDVADENVPDGLLFLQVEGGCYGAALEEQAVVDEKTHGKISRCLAPVAAADADNHYFRPALAILF